MTDTSTDQVPKGARALTDYARNRAEIDLSIEVVLLLVGGLYFLLFGLLLFPISTGALPYSEGAMYGLFVVLISMQIITMGKTPFGDLLRSWIVVIAGIGTAIVGTLAIFYPGDTTGLIRVLAGAIVLVTGALGLVLLATAEDRARTWLGVPGMLRHLAVAWAAVYGLEVVLGVITLVPGLVPVQLTAVLTLVFGAALVVPRPGDPLGFGPVRPRPGGGEGAGDVGEPEGARQSPLRRGRALRRRLVQRSQGVLLILFGCLVLFMILGAIPPFNGDGQLGLLLVLTSLQMLALGQVVGSTLARSWVLVAAGLAFAAMGIVSCIVPGVISSVISPLLGIQNIITGVVLLGTLVIGPTLFGIRHPPAEPVAIPPLVKRLLLILAATGIVAILFGLNMLAPFLLPGLLGVVAFALFLPVLIVVTGLLMLGTVYKTRKLG